jgi:hypothetical protein
MNAQTKSRRGRTSARLARNSTPERSQSLAIHLNGITAGDYLTWVHDPDPPALGRGLRSIAIEADPLGERIDVDLVWELWPPDPHRAAAAAGFALTPEVAAVRCSDHQRHPGNRRGDRRSR